MIINWKFFFLVYYISQIISGLFVTEIMGKSGFSSIPYIRLGYIVPLILLTFLYLLNSRFKIAYENQGWIDFLFKVIFASSFVWFVSGVGNGFYFLTDFAYLMLSVFTYFSVRKSLSVNEVNISVLYVFFLKLYFFIALIYLFIGPVMGVYCPTVILMQMSIFMMVLVFSDNKLNPKEKIMMYIMTFFILSNITLLNRAFYLQLFIILGMLFFIEMSFKKKIKFSIFVLFTISIVFLGYSSFNKHILSGTQLERRINETMEIFDDGITEKTSIPMIQRIYESNLVVENLEKTPIRILTGFGFGATLDMSDSMDDSVKSTQLIGSDSTHNIHFIHMAMLYRYGLIGVFIYVSIFFVSFISYIKIRKYLNFENKKSVIFVSFMLYPFSLLIFSSTASSYFFVDPMFSFSIAISEYCRIKIIKEYQLSNQ